MADPLKAADSAPPEDDDRERRATAGQLGRRLLRILAPTRVRRLSLHDAAGEVLWVNEGELGAPDLRQLQDAQDAFELDAALNHIEREVDNARALFFCARGPQGERTGLAFAVVSSRRRPDIKPEALQERVFATMRRFGAAPVPGSVDSGPGLPAFRVRSSDRVASAPEPASDPKPAPASTADQSTPPESASLESTPTESDSLEYTPTPESAEGSEGSEGSDTGMLRSRPYVRLRPGGTTRRYEIAASGKATCEQDLKLAVRLIGFLQRRRGHGATAPVSFTLPLCAASVLSSLLLDSLTPLLEIADLAEDILGFSIPAASWERDFAATEGFIERCGQLRCFVALDDFNLTRSGFALLRAGAPRCLKLDVALTDHVLTDKFAHANVAAIAKAARVLGLYCVAKSVKTPDAARWLASAGVEFADRATRVRTSGATTRSARALTLASGR
jgi:EAL domain